MTSIYPIDEKALLNKFKSGDELAFDKIFRSHNTALVFFANRLLINHDQANSQDIVLVEMPGSGWIIFF